MSASGSKLGAALRLDAARAIVYGCGVGEML